MIDLSVAKRVDPTAEGVEVAFEVDPLDLYPQVSAYLSGVIEDGRTVPANLTLHLEEARAAGVEALEMCHTPTDLVPADLVVARAAALTACRRYFTEALHASVGYAKMQLRIIPNEDFRLVPRR